MNQLVLGYITVGIDVCLPDFLLLFCFLHMLTQTILTHTVAAIKFSEFLS